MATRRAVKGRRRAGAEADELPSVSSSEEPGGTRTTTTTFSAQTKAGSSESIQRAFPKEASRESRVGGGVGVGEQGRAKAGRRLELLGGAGWAARESAGLQHAARGAQGTPVVTRPHSADDTFDCVDC